jgi:hypothetical protein
LHPLQHAGLSRRSPVCPSSSPKCTNVRCIVVRLPRREVHLFTREQATAFGPANLEVARLNLVDLDAADVGSDRVLPISSRISCEEVKRTLSASSGSRRAATSQKTSHSGFDEPMRRP